MAHSHSVPSQREVLAQTARAMLSNALIDGLQSLKEDAVLILWETAKAGESSALVGCLGRFVEETFAILIAHQIDLADLTHADLGNMPIKQ